MKTVRQLEAQANEIARVLNKPGQTLYGAFADSGLGLPDTEGVRLGLDGGSVAFRNRKQLGDGGRAGMMLALHGAITFISYHIALQDVAKLTPLYELMGALQDAERGKKHPALSPRSSSAKNSLDRKEIEFYARCLVAADIHRAHRGTSRLISQATILRREDVGAAAQLHGIDLPKSDNSRHLKMENWRRHLRERSSRFGSVQLIEDRTVRARHSKILNNVLLSLLRGDRLQHFKQGVGKDQYAFCRHRDLRPLLRNFSKLKMDTIILELCKNLDA